MPRSGKLTMVLQAAVLAVVFLLSAGVFNADAQTRRKPQPKPKPKAVKPQPPKLAVRLLTDLDVRDVIRPRRRPLLINFWATWCDPCREEFPDLVAIDREFKGKIDFITVSLDDPEDIATRVPQFLASMKAEMPAYLLSVSDEGEIISLISPDWRGGMPFTALFSTAGKLVYFREGKIVPEVLRREIVKVLAESAEEIKPEGTKMPSPY